MGVVLVRAEYNQAEADLPKPIELTESQRESLRRKSGQGILRVLGAQSVMLAFAVGVSGAVGGWGAAVSALVGGMAYFLPNALFALRLFVGLWGSRQSSPFTFFIGEAFKLASAVVVLGLVAWFGKQWVVWPALLFGLLCVLKGYVLLLMFRRLP